MIQPIKIAEERQLMQCIKYIYIYIYILRIYWYQLTMVARSGRYFGLPFKGYRGVTQVDPLSPTLFNVFMYSAIIHWVTVVALTKAGMEGLGLSIQDLVAYFYANDGFVALTQPERLHRAFEVLTGLFDWVGLRKNTQKTGSMACQTCDAPGRMPGEAYGMRMTGTGPTFQEQQWRRVELPE